MYFQRLSTALLLLISIFFCATVAGQSVKEAQAELTSLKQQQTELLARQQQLQSVSRQKNAKLKPLLKKTPLGEGQLNRARRMRDDADTSYRAERTSDTKSILKNAEFKYALALRKFKRANAERFSLEQQIMDASAQLAALSKEASALTSRISEQQRTVAEVRSQQQVKERARRARLQDVKARRAQQAKIDAAEIVRLKAEREQQESQQQATVTAAAKATAATKRGSKASLNAPAPEKTATQAVAAAHIARSGNVQSAAKTAEAKQDYSFAVVLTTKQQVNAEKRRLQQLLDTPGARSNLYKDKVLFMKPITADGTIKRRSRPKKLRALGHHQYSGKARLRAGKVIFLVDSDSWQQSQSVKSKGGKYTVILDSRDSDNPRLVYYPVSLDN